MPDRSRLSRRLENQTKKRLLINLVGIVVILVLVITFAIPLIGTMSTFLAGAKNAVETSEKKDEFRQPPVLDTQPAATNSAQVHITGTAFADQSVVLYVNGIKQDSVKTKKDGTFSFTDVTLEKGKNTIKTKALVDKKETAFSNEIAIEYKSEPPSLTIDNPKDGQTFGKDDSTTNVTGKTDPGARITVNNFWAIVEDNGDFSYMLRLQGGENKITVTATDEAENKTQKEIKVNRNQ